MPLVDVSVFYTFLFALVKFKKSNIWDWLKSSVRFLLSFALIVIMNIIRAKIAKYYGITLHNSFVDLLYDTIYLYSSFAFYAVGYYYLNKSNTKQKELRQLAEEKATKDAVHAKLQQNMLEMENNFLRAQINPHFLYNTLNLFYAKALPVSKDLANGILTLSDIMRYSLETTHGGQLVSLQAEAEHLERIISMHQLRFANRLHIEFTTQGKLAGIQVAPLIFITLLENALKHGDAEDPNEPIALWLAADATHIYFAIRNKKTVAIKEYSHGIGLDNIKKRLANVYGNRYQLSIEETESIYEVALAIAYPPENIVENKN